MEGARVTALLAAWSAGDSAAEEQLFPLIYPELRRRAAARLRGERQGHTLQPTALVHEAYLRLLGQRATWENRAHFYAVSSRLMRRVLVDHARRARRLKRFGGCVQVTVEDPVAADAPAILDCLALDDALTRLASVDERKARIAELRFFSGLSTTETARVLGVSTATIEREWRTTRAWLYTSLQGGKNERISRMAGALTTRANAASEPDERSEPAKRRASEAVGEPEGRSPSDET